VGKFLIGVRSGQVLHIRTVIQFVFTAKSPFHLLIFFFTILERIIHIRTNACSSEAFEQSASFCGPDLRAQQDPFLMILIIGERMRYK